MSEAASVAEAPVTEAPSSAPAPSGFMGAPPPAPAPAAPAYLFADGFHKDGVLNEGWTESFAEKYPSLAGKLSTAKDHAGAMSILNNAVQVAGRREIKGAPDETWQAHEVAEYRRAHNVPEQASEYGFAPAKPPEGQHWDGETVKGFEALMHKHNIPKAFAAEASEFYSGLLSKQTEHGLGEFNRQVEQANQKADAWAQKEWGADYEQRFEAWQSFVDSRIPKEVQATPAFKIALRQPEIIAAFEMARESLREGNIPGVSKEYSSGSMSPKQQYEKLMADNPDWQTNPMKGELAKRIIELANLQSAQDKRRK